MCLADCSACRIETFGDLAEYVSNINCDESTEGSKDDTAGEDDDEAPKNECPNNNECSGNKVRFCSCIFYIARVCTPICMMLFSILESAICSVGEDPLLDRCFIW